MKYASILTALAITMVVVSSSCKKEFTYVCSDNMGNTSKEVINASDEESAAGTCERIGEQRGRDCKIQ